MNAIILFTQSVLKSILNKNVIFSTTGMIILTTIMEKNKCVRNKIGDLNLSTIECNHTLHHSSHPHPYKIWNHFIIYNFTAGQQMPQLLTQVIHKKTRAIQFPG